MSTDDSGVTEGRSTKSRLNAKFIKLLTDGEWLSMDLANNCKAWEQAMKNTNAVLDTNPYLNPQLLRTMALRRRRLFSAIKCDGGDEATTGSFAWVTKQGIELLDSRDSRSGLPQEVDQTVQWWLKAAIAEAGMRFASDLNPDSDFAKPLRNVFLLNNGSVVRSG